MGSSGLETDKTLADREGEEDFEDQFDDIDLDESLEEQTASRRCSKRFQKYMILPNNPKLQKFHYLASISLFVDFIVSGFCIGNYEFQIGLTDEKFIN